MTATTRTINFAFKNEDVDIFVELISIIQHGKLWVNANTIASIFGFFNPNIAIEKHVSIGNQTYCENIPAIHPNTKFINKAGLFELIAQSKIKGFCALRDWMKNHVLPLLRQKLCATATYNNNVLSKTRIDLYNAQQSCILLQNKIESLKKINEEATKRTIAIEEFYCSELVLLKNEIIRGQGQQNAMQESFNNDMTEMQAVYSRELNRINDARIHELAKTSSKQKQVQNMMSHRLLVYHTKIENDNYYHAIRTTSSNLKQKRKGTLIYEATSDEKINIFRSIKCRMPNQPLFNTICTRKIEVVQFIAILDSFVQKQKNIMRVF
jgi:prophage antirepressor-like protein